jgi:hypothetical protein
MRGRHLIAGLAAALLLGACGGDKTGPNDGGDNGGGGTSGTTFSATVTGDIATSLSGAAYYGDGNDGTTSGGFAIALGLSATPTATIIIGREQSGVPATGTYALTDVVNGTDEPTPADFVAQAQFHYQDQEDQVCASTGGQVQITSAGSDRVQGKFTATMTCVPLLHQIDGPTKSITVTGTFDSKKAVIPNPEF